MAALGERFRAAREARGLSLSDVAEQIRIRSVYLGAIEDENWTAIGAPVYTRGFLRTYARFLGLDPEEVVEEFNRSAPVRLRPCPRSAPEASHPAPACAAHGKRPRAIFRPSFGLRRSWRSRWSAFVFYNEVHDADAGKAQMRHRSPSNSPATVAGTPRFRPSPGASIVPASVPSPRTPAANTLELRLSAASWVRVAVDGSVSMEGTFPAGTARKFHGKNAVLRIGNAGGVEVVCRRQERWKAWGGWRCRGAQLYPLTVAGR